MPSTEHELLLDLSQNRPDFLTELLRGSPAAAVIPDGVPRVCGTNLTESVPVEFRADQVLVYTDPRAPLEPPPDTDSETREPAIAALVIEVQRSRDDDKRYSWPAYVAVARAQHRCPTSLLVLCTARDVAEWAARPIHLGPKGFDLEATVIGPDDTPYVDTSEHAAASPELAVISAIVHGREEGRGRDVLHALVAGFDPTANRGGGTIAERHQRYLVGVGALLPEDARTIMEEFMLDTRYGYQDIFTRHFAEGEAEGEAKGEARGEARSVLRVLETRGLDIPEDVRDEVLACTDKGTLDAWLERAVIVSNAKELFD